MKSVIKFSKLFIPAAVFSGALVVLGIVGYAVKGFNYGVDFRAGINETVQMAIPALEVTYSGEGNATLTFAKAAATLVISGTKSDDKTLDLPYSSHKTVGELSSALTAVSGVKVALKCEPGLASLDLIANQQGSNVLGAEPFRIHRKILDPSERFADISQVRKVADSLGDAAVQVAGDKTQQMFMIRIQDKGTDPAFSKNIPGQIRSALEAEFGADRIIILSTDIVGAALSQNLGWTASWVVALAVLAILAYVMIRFKPQYAIGAVLAILHDALMMVCFVVWTRMEFNSVTIAAILTILGFSINDTIVIFDRIREDKKLFPDLDHVSLMDTAITETLSRTIITTVCTLLCVFTLYFFTAGSMKDFALVLIVGLVSGTYSTIYIATAFVVLWENMAKKSADKKLRKIEGQKAAAKAGKPAKA